MILSIVFALLLIFGVSSVYAEEYIINIPYGAYNPELNTPAQVWFDPPIIVIHAGDTLTWYNDDKEAHVVASGEGSGRFGWMGDNFGTQDGYFSSERFMPTESWSFTFTQSGTFPYFCTIHPWMEAVVIVQDPIPDYPVDATGEKITFPLLQYTDDKTIEVNLTWEPYVIKTHEKIKFIYQFYDPTTNSNLANMNYNIIIFQNGKELYRDSGKNQIGGDYRDFIFTEPGSFTVRFSEIEKSGILSEESVTVEGSAIAGQRTADFTGVVFENTQKTTHEAYHVKPAQRLEVYYELAILFILVPAGIFIAIIFWLKKKPSLPSEKTGAI